MLVELSWVATVPQRSAGVPDASARSCGTFDSATSPTNVVCSFFCGLTDRIEPFLGHCRCSNLVSEKQSIHTAMSDTTKLSCLCRVRFGGVNWIPDNSRLSLTENLKSEHVNSNCPIHTTTPDTTQTILFRRVCYMQRYGDLTVFRMAAVRHLGFLKFNF